MLASTRSGSGTDPGRASAIACSDRPLAKSMNDAWQNAA